MRTLAAKLATGSLLGLLVLGSACVSNDISLVIEKVLVVQLTNCDETTGICICEWTTDNSDYSCLKPGMLDIGNAHWASTPQGAPFYTLVLLVDNYLPNNSQPEIGQLDNHKVRIDHVEVSYRWKGTKTNELLDSNPGLEMLRILEDSAVSAQFSVSQDVIDSSTDGIVPFQATVTAEVLPADVGQVLLSALSGQPPSLLSYLTLEMQIRLVGRTTGGMRVESAPYSFITNFCDGCLGETGCFPGQSTYNSDCIVSE